MHGFFCLVSLWQRLDEWDKAFFIRLNSQWTNPVFDTIFPYFRDSYFWVPLYLFLFLLISLNYGSRGLWWSLVFICTVAITDVIGAKGLKETVQRLRPCKDPEFFFHVRFLLKQCSESFSFVSNHAANHFALATFAFFTLRGEFRHWMWLAYLWAFLIAYGQVYVGVHYPLDVIGGALLGCLTGLLTASIYHRVWGRINLNQIS